MTEAEVAIIGAGPAGLAAAAMLAEAGVAVTLIDEQTAPGGQIYRGVGAASPKRLGILGADYAAGLGLTAATGMAGVTYRPGATVWELTRERQAYFSADGRAEVLQAAQVIVATGATERPMPFPGWTLPGVMTAGAGQILLKTAGLVPPEPVVLAGSGPLLFLVAQQYLDAGARVAAIVETTPAANRARAARHLPGMLVANRYLRKGLAMLRRLRAAGVPHYRQATGLRAEGRARVEAIGFDAQGARHRVECAALLIHTGVVPNVQITRALGLAHDWDPLQGCWRPRLGRFGETEVPGIRVAGDGGGIAGAEAAVHSGRLAALGCLSALGKGGDIGARAAAAHRALKWHGRARPFLDALYAPAPEFLDPPDETVVCRCEEVTAGRIREFVDLGCLGPNQTKAFGRPGMGPCQGRYCGLTVANVIAARRGVPVAEVGYYRLRAPVKPVTLGELAAMEIDDADADGPA